MTKTLTVNGVKGLNRAFANLPKAAQVEMRDAGVRIAAKVASGAASKARTTGGLAALVAPTLRATRDRVPKVVMGSAKRLPARNGFPRSASHQTIGDVMWGAEFGGGRRATTQQFSPWRGSGQMAGYFLYPTIRRDNDMIMDEYADAWDAAIDRAAGH